MHNRFLISSAVTTAIALVASPASAIDVDYSSTVSANNIPIASITVGATDEVLADNKFYDRKDVEYLEADLRKHLEKAFGKAGLLVAGGAGAKLDIEFTKLTSNRPTLQAYRKKPGLDFRSFGHGGAAIKGHLTAADGTDLGSFEYSWYEDQFHPGSADVSVWYDAHRAIATISRRLAREWSDGRPDSASS